MTMSVLPKARTSILATDANNNITQVRVRSSVNGVSKRVVVISTLSNTVPQVTFYGPKALVVMVTISFMDSSYQTAISISAVTVTAILTPR